MNFREKALRIRKMLQSLHGYRIINGFILQPLHLGGIPAAKFKAGVCGAEIVFCVGDCPGAVVDTSHTCRP